MSLSATMAPSWSEMLGTVEMDFNKVGRFVIYKSNTWVPSGLTIQENNYGDIQDLYKQKWYLLSNGYSRYCVSYKSWSTERHAAPHLGPGYLMLVWSTTWQPAKVFPDIFVRRAGLMRSQQDSEWWWSVPFTCAWLYMSFLLFCLICAYSSQFSILFWIIYLL